jgi:hypothetical protein
MEVVNNDLVKGASGRIGDQLVYRQRGAKTIIAKRPKPKEGPPTQAQIEIQERFYNGVLYAKTVVADEAKKAVYQAKATGYQTAYNLAVSDFCKAPQITQCDTDAYTGQPGQLIRIRAADDFKVQSVSVEIKDGTNTVLEEGAAVLNDNGVDWMYTTQEENLQMLGTKLIVSATDLPQNLSKREFTL